MEMKQIFKHSQIDPAAPSHAHTPPVFLPPLPSSFSLLHPSTLPATVSPAVRGYGGVTDVLMWPRFLITTQLKAPFALVCHDRWEAEAERSGDAMLTNGRGGISEAEEVCVGGGDEVDTHCWKW